MERNAKRRKLNPTSSQTPIRTTPRARAASSKHETPTLSKEASTTRAVSSYVGENAKDDETQDIQGISEALIHDSTEMLDTNEEIVVRSSSRVRRLPAKLQGHDAIPSSRASIPRSRTTPMRATTRDSSIALNNEGANTPQSANVGSVNSKRLQATKKDKENVTPPLSVHNTTPSAHEKESSARQMSQRSARTTKTLLIDNTSTQADLAIAEAAISAIKHRTTGTNSIRSVQAELLARATGRKPIPIVDRKDEYNKVASLVKQAVESGESNSMILIGGRGTGKTTLVNQILEAQQESHPDAFHTVRLNGFIHTDDKLALRDIWRQLGREMELDEQEITVRSYADTLSMLLALLSQPGDADHNTSITKSIIFVLDEFDLFATHPRQTLLYNLFDIAQSRKAPIAILGLTTRVDVVEALEKRVKSRFSHRYIHLPAAKSLAQFTEICQAFMEYETPGDAWNNAMRSLFVNEDFAYHLRKIYHRSKSIPDFLATMLLPIGTLQLKDSFTNDEIIQHFLSTTSMAALGQDSKLDLLRSLSNLQMALLICAARQNAIFATENITYNLAYEEYKAIASKTKLQASASGALSAGSRVWGKDVAKNAWADLIDLGLIMEDGRGIGKVDVALEEIASSGVELGQWARWCKEI